MFISDHPIGSSVTVSISKDGDTVELTTTITNVIDDKKRKLILCDVITSGDKIISFDGLLCKVTISGADGRDYIYMTRAVQNIVINKNKVLMIQCSSNVKPENKRKAYRYPICVNVVIRPKQHRGTCDGFLRDISQTGISFSIPDLSYCPYPGELISLTFEFEGIRHKLECFVVRTVQREDGGYVIGGELTKYNSQVQHLISRLGMLEARIRREQKNTN